ncbi:MAG TPA: GerMN domain-containing protein [Coleofasciculaceae cyanobacterium]|jgi:hypothetical protein
MRGIRLFRQALLPIALMMGVLAAQNAFALPGSETANSGTSNLHAAPARDATHEGGHQEIARTPSKQAVSITGTLAPTVEAGGWTVTGPNNLKYVLLGTGNVEHLPWFKSGNLVKVQGQVRTDLTSIYQEGPILEITTIEPAPAPTQKLEQATRPVALYFPNILNTLRDPGFLLGNPTTRHFQEPRLPEQAINAILRGPNNVERLRGFFEDEEVMQLRLEQFSITPDGTATVILDAPANFQFRNTTAPSRLQRQLEQTLKQFEGIRTVSIAIRGPGNTILWSEP